MARRERNAKQLAQRIDLDYLKKPHPFRRWRFWLAVAAPAIALLWVLTLAVVGRQQPYSSGPLSPSHAVLGAQCGVCHKQTLGFFLRHVGDAACLECHDGPTHQANQTFTPTCASCHLEHRGAILLARVDDATCTQCHAGLKVASGEPRFVRAIAGFGSGHPEFFALRGKKDPGTIKLNHKVHLKPDLKGPRGPVQMECWDCHRPEGNQDPWPYGDAQAQKGSPSASPAVEAAAPSRRGARTMAPPTYAKTCAACHALGFDARIAEPVPHGKPEALAEFVRVRYREYLARHPGEWHKVVRVERRLPDSPAPPPPPRNAAEWVEQQAAAAETLLWRKTCAECHTPQPQSAGRTPSIPPANITAVWMPNARFNHESHRLLKCAACHVAEESQETTDLLLPGIATCRQCHTSGSESAGDTCALCHAYHDWSKEKRPPSRFRMNQILKGN